MVLDPEEILIKSTEGEVITVDGQGHIPRGVLKGDTTRTSLSETYLEK